MMPNWMEKTPDCCTTSTEYPPKNTANRPQLRMEERLQELKKEAQLKAVQQQQRC
jgi:hypothetical protein